MHTHKQGGRENRPPANKSEENLRFGDGIRKIRDRARLSNAVGYDSKQAPRIPRR